jgi:hypothetical protein
MAAAEKSRMRENNRYPPEPETDPGEEDERLTR